MKRILLSVFLLCIVSAPFMVSAAIVPCHGPECQACDFIALGQRVITWFISIMASIIAIVFAWGGMKMVMSGGSTEGVSEGKRMMTNAVVGFVILMAAWLIVDTVMKLVVDGSKVGVWNKIECVAPVPRTEAPVTTTPGSVTAGGVAAGYTVVPSGINVKSTACSGSSECSISDSITEDLSALDAKLDEAGINWQVTEAYPPTRVHQNACHQNGTCVDANCIGGCNASQVKTFLDSASASGLKAVYEVKTETQKSDLIKAGVNASQVSVLGDWISAPHFSVYDS